MKHLSFLAILFSLLATPAPLRSAEPKPADFDTFKLHFPKNEHLTASQLYQKINTAVDRDKIIGQFVLLDVTVTIEREVPLVEIEIPGKKSESPSSSPKSISAHLISVTSMASSLKKGDHLRIEGIIVDEGYGAYTIYLHGCERVK